MNPAPGLRSRLTIVAIIISLTFALGWLIWPVGKFVLFGIAPLCFLVLSIGVLPVRMSPGRRLVVSIVVMGVFFVLRALVASSAIMRSMTTSIIGIGPPVDLIGAMSSVVAVVWFAGQLVLVVVADRVRSGSGGVVEAALAEGGYVALLRSITRGEFGMRPALWITGARWGAFILVGSLLLYRSDSLLQLEEDLVLPLARTARYAGPSSSMIVSLTTGDNNPRGYLRTAIDLNARFTAAGATVVCFPSRGSLDSVASRLADSLRNAGAIVFDQHVFDPWYMWIGIGRGYNLIKFRATAFSSEGGTPLIHPSLLAAARFKQTKVHVDVRGSTLPILEGRPIHTVRYPKPDVWVGQTRIPRWEYDGSVVLRRQGYVPMQYSPGGDTLWNSFIFPVNIEQREWDGPILYKDLVSGSTGPTLPDSVWRFAKGKMVFVQWVNWGEGSYHDYATDPALIADMVVRGMLIAEAPPWHVLVSVLVVLVGMTLFTTSRPWVVLVVLFAMAVGLGALDGWIFREYLLITHLIYPAFTGLVAAAVLPLVRSSVRF